MSRPFRIVSRLSAAVLVVGAPLAWWGTLPPADVGSLPPAQAAAAPDLPDVEVTSPTLEALGLTAPPAPVELRIPAIGVAAEIVRVGQAEPGVMEVPSDVSTVGWYQPGVAPGRPGSAVIAGHVDSRHQGRGAFFDLQRTGVDDLIEIVDDEGVTRTWRVVARHAYGKNDLPAAELFSRDGEPRLTLITCGGPFDAAAGSYEHNIVVVAVPA